MKKRLPLLPFLEGKEIRLDTSSRLEWVESSFEETRDWNSHSQDFLGVSVKRRTVTLFFFFMMVCVGLVLGKTAYLQTVQGTTMAHRAESNKVRVVPIPAMRGVMYDRTHIPLATNKAFFSLTITPADLPNDSINRESLFATLAPLTEQTPDQLKVMIKNPSSYEPVVVMDGFPYSKALELSVATSSMPGISVVSNGIREYDYRQASSLAHVIGYTSTVTQRDLDAHPDIYLSKDQIGKVGVERTYDSVLRGSHGEKSVEVDALGKVQKVISTTPAVNGDSLVLSIDARLQKESQDALQLALDAIHQTKGVVIISRPHNGEILALVNIPYFDGNLFSGGISVADYDVLSNDVSHPLFDRAVSGEYPSGSTVKPMVALAALEEGIVKASTTVNSTGGIHIGQWFYPDWKTGGHGITNIYKALAESVNTYFYIISGGFGDIKGLGAEKLKTYYERFGLGKITGIDLPSEASGVVPSPDWKKEVKGEAWYVGDTYHLGIGQGDLLVTPLQIHTTSAYFANGGYNVIPHVVIGKENSQTHERENISFPQYISGVGSPESISTIRDGLHQTVISGSARMLQSVLVSVAGKTGTAQWSPDKNPHAWFTGWAPFDNPEIVITVLIEEGEDGTLPAVQVTRNILTWYFGHDGANSRANDAIDIQQ
ncbi:MAG: penicillin-binding protein 2 [bacterium]|nr:penicillin-binding protein 2 [bacterium]